MLCDNADKTQQHLFSYCCITKCLWLKLLNWLVVHMFIGNWKKEVEWVVNQEKGKSGRGVIICNAFARMVNIIWREKKPTRFQQGSY